MKQILTWVSLFALFLFVSSPAAGQTTGGADGEVTIGEPSVVVSVSQEDASSHSEPRQMAQDRGRLPVEPEVQTLPRGTISVLTNEPNAEVWIDGAPVGYANQRFSLEAGGHLLTIRERHREPSTVQVVVTPDQYQLVQFAQQPQRSRRIRTSAVFWSLVGLSAASFFVSGYLAMKEEQTYDRYEYEFYSERETFFLGWVSSVVVGATLALSAIIVGALTDWRGRRSRRNTRGFSSPSLTASLSATVVVPETASE